MARLCNRMYTAAPDVSGSACLGESGFIPPGMGTTKVGRPQPFCGPHQSIGDGLLPVIQVHVVVVVARAGVHSHAGGDGEQEASVIP